MRLLAKSKLVTAPTEDALNLATVKEFLRLDGTADDAALTAIIKGSTKRVESYIDQKLITQTWDIFFDGFPASYGDGHEPWWDGMRQGAISELSKSVPFMEMPFGPLASASVKYINEAGTEMTYDSAGYVIDTRDRHGAIVLKSGYLWPTDILTPVNGVVVRGVFGYGGQTDVPDDIKQALMNLVAFLYEHRDDNQDLPAMPASAQLLLEPYREIKI
jgi:hypothetical protein